MTSILCFQCLQKSLHNGDNKGVMCEPTKTAFRPACPIIYTNHRSPSGNGNNPQLSRDIYETTDSIWWHNHFRHTNTENMTTMREVDTSDLMIMMMIRRVEYIYYRSHKLQRISLTYTMREVYTSDLMMIKRRVTDIYYRSPTLQRISLTYTMREVGTSDLMTIIRRVTDI